MDPWAILRRGGLPLGAADDAGPPPDATTLGTAVVRAIASAPTGRERDALAAFVLAWSRHWPRTFAAVFADHEQVAEWARRAVDDPNRYLKLARIATEHLAHVL